MTISSPLIRSFSIFFKISGTGNLIILLVLKVAGIIQVVVIILLLDTRVACNQPATLIHLSDQSVGILMKVGQ